MVSASSNLLSLPGYWDWTSTASIDFCEPNYIHTPYIAELFNTLSSLFIVYIGIAGLLRTFSSPHCSPCKYERWAYYAIYANAFAIGLGSCTLHATLSMFGQASDEVPMVLANVFVVAFLIEHKSPPNQLKVPLMPLYCIAGVLFCIWWYLRFQDNYFAFLALYVGGVLFLISWLVKLVFFKRADPWEDLQRRNKMIPCFWAAMGSYAMLGFGAWVMDMLLCEFILSQWTILQMFLHPVWHIGAGIGTHLALCLASLIRCTALHKETEFKLFMGVPFVEVVEEEVAMFISVDVDEAAAAPVAKRGRAKTPTPSKRAKTPTPSKKRAKTPTRTPLASRSESRSANIDSPGLVKCRRCGKAAKKGNYGFCTSCREPTKKKKE